MTGPEFERQLAEIRASIADLPPEQREALEALARETVERHEQIVRASLEGRRVVERLELAWERLGEACARVGALAADARVALARAPAPPPLPGLN